MDPQQELFTAIRMALAERFGEENVYDGFLPPEGTPYPFVYIADSQLTDDPSNKTAIWGRVTQTVHFWHNSPEYRGTLSRMMLRSKLAIRQIEHTDNFAWRFVGLDQRVLTDTTTKQPLLHGVLEFTFTFN